MSGKINRPPTGEAWIWMTGELLASDAMRTMSGKARKVLNFLMLEHMAKGGKKNGKLKATHRQLAAAGISEHYVKAAIDECEELGLIECGRGGMRVATIYALTWLPLHDGTPASNQWRTYRNPELQPMTQAKIRNLPTKQQAGLPPKQQADCPNLPPKQQADCPQNLPPKQQALLRKDSYQGGDDTTDLSAGDGRGDAMPPVAASAAPPAHPSFDLLEIPAFLDRRLRVVGQ